MALKKIYNKKIKYTSDEIELCNSIGAANVIEIDGVTYSDAYFRIESITGNKNKLMFTVMGYSDNTLQQSVFKKEYIFIPAVDENSENFIKQGYEYLKTLEEYADAVDC